MICGFRRFRIVMIASLLTACSAGGEFSATDDPREARPPAHGLLKPAESESELEQFLQAGFLNDPAYTEVYYPDYEQEFEPPPSGDPEPGPGLPDGEDSGAPIDGRFSTTNLQEAGVEEADIVKYDGEILYVVDFDFDYHGENKVIRLLRTDPATPATQLLSEVPLPAEDFDVDGLYLRNTAGGKQMLAVMRSYSSWYRDEVAGEWEWRGKRTRLQSWQVHDPAQPYSDWSLEIAGSLMASRRIENTLYLLSRFSPEIEGLVPYPRDEDEVATNLALIENTSLDSLLPEMRREDDVSRQLLAFSDCYVPNTEYTGLTVPPVSGSLITVTAINLDAPDSVTSTCFNTYANDFYASTESIYITANSAADNTLIHKVKLQDSGPEYRGSGEVPGYLGTNSPAFLMSERAGDLRVVSSSWAGRFFPGPVFTPEAELDIDGTTIEDDGFGRHRLTVLRESGDGIRLEQIARLPNAEHPELIGKPGEDIYSARFLGDRAYIVTFEVVDPLYVLDLADPEDPVVSGELEIPGFSTQLQPLGENLLLGIGYDVSPWNPGFLDGVKLALFDVSNLDSPIQLDQRVIGIRGSDSPALYDHHSLTQMEIDGRYRVALPVVAYEEFVEIYDPGPLAFEAEVYYHTEWSDSGLRLFDIDPANGTISNSGQMIVDKTSADDYYDYPPDYPPDYLDRSRSVLHEEAVFFINQGEIYSQHWGETNDFSDE